MRPKVAYEFGGIRFEPLNLRLVHGDGIVPVTVKAADTLTVLLQHPGVVVTKEELLAAVWPDAAVEENNLNQQISALRRALSRNGGGPFIETVPRRGYRFVMDVRTVPLSRAADAQAGDAPQTPEIPSRTGGRDAASVRVSLPSQAPIGSALARRAHLPRTLVWLAVITVGLLGAWPAWVYQRNAASEASAAARELADRHRVAGSYRMALAEYERAIRIDPRNALAHSGLALTLDKLSYGDSVRRPAGESPSVAAAQRAVELDPSCAYCHGSLGLFLFYHDWDWPRAEWHLREALRLAPDNEGLRPSYAMLLAATGRVDQALDQIESALSRRPYQASWLVLRAAFLYLQRRYPEAVAAADRALLIDDEERGAWEWRSRALFQMGRGEEAVEALAKVAFAAHGDRLEAAVLEGGGRQGLEVLLELTGGWQQRVEQSWRRAPWRALLRDRAGTLEELERAYDHRNLNLIYLATDPVYDEVRDDPRFERILSGMGLTDVLRSSR